MDDTYLLKLEIQVNEAVTEASKNIGTAIDSNIKKFKELEVAVQDYAKKHISSMGATQEQYAQVEKTIVDLQKQMASMSDYPIGDETGLKKMIELENQYLDALKNAQSMIVGNSQLDVQAHTK